MKKHRGMVIKPEKFCKKRKIVENLFVFHHFSGFSSIFPVFPQFLCVFAPFLWFFHHSSVFFKNFFDFSSFSQYFSTFSPVFLSKPSNISVVFACGFHSYLMSNKLTKKSLDKAPGFLVRTPVLELS